MNGRFEPTKFCIDLLDGTMDRGNQSKSSKPKRYGIAQEDTARYGLCWRYDVRVQNIVGKLCRRNGSGFAAKAECETAVAALRGEISERIGSIFREFEKNLCPAVV